MAQCGGDTETLGTSGGKDMGNTRDVGGHGVVKTQGCQGQQAVRTWGGVGHQMVASPRTPGMLSFKPQHIPPGSAAANSRQRPGR